VTDNAVIVLDGASAFEPVDVDPGIYAEALGRSIANELTKAPDGSIAEAVAEAIHDTTAKLDLHPGASPSSTVAILRTRPGALDLLALGDSPIHYGIGNQACSRRRAALDCWEARKRALRRPAPRRPRLRRRSSRRTCPAPARRSATSRAATGSLKLITQPPTTRSQGPWTGTGSSGRSSRRTGRLTSLHAGHGWHDIANHDSAQLTALLANIHDWEEESDPHGRHLPRAKQRDGKSIAAIAPLWE
jgi:hypothetical protein